MTSCVAKTCLQSRVRRKRTGRTSTHVAVRSEVVIDIAAPLLNALQAVLPRDGRKYANGLRLHAQQPGNLLQVGI